MSKAQSSDSATSQANSDDALLDSIRAILLRDDREQIDTTIEAAQHNIEALHDQIASLQKAVAELETTKADAAAMVPTIQRELSEIADGAVQTDHSAMAEALGPVIGAATTVQIRKSKQEMADALAPVMSSAIAAAIREALEDVQRGFDARMTHRAKSNGFVRRLYYRSRGTSESEAVMRHALPYNVREIFLIHKTSGLLLAHHSDSAETTDSDLVSAMLTAIRDFVGDAFSTDGEATELNQVQYNDDQIVIKSGEFAYVAAVVEGIVPAGLGSELQLMIASLNGDHRNVLQAYDGDPDTLPDFEPMLANFSAEFDESNMPDEVPRDFSMLVRTVGAGIILGGLAILGFLLWFGWRLYPVAVNGGVSAESPAPIVTISTVGETWLMSAPSEDSTQLVQIPPGAKLELVAIQGVWRKIEWQHEQSAVIGWTQSRNVTNPDELPIGIVTPVP